MPSLKGHLLIAVPQLTDPNFARTVVLLIEHTDEGALGVVLNRPSSATVKDVWEQVGEEPSDCLEPINMGGPVQGPLMALHTIEPLSEAQVLPEVYLATRREYLDQLVRRDGATFRLFSGYAGWGGGQLEQELRAGGWLTKPAKSDYIFYEAEDLWQKVGRDITDEVLGPTLKNAEIPPDPSLN